MIKEEWKPVKDYEGLYEVSNLGRVKSLRFNKERILKPIKDGRGYINVGLSSKKHLVHQLVAINFLNHTPCGMKLVVDHINNNPLDNRLENLQLISFRENSSKDIKNKSSKYTGVSWDKSRNKWTSTIYILKKSIKLGRFKNEYDAHIAYQNKLKTI